MRACQWCGKGFETKPNPGPAQLFCSAACRGALHTAARRYALRLLDEGFITTANLQAATEAANLIDHREVQRLKLEEGNP